MYYFANFLNQMREEFSLTKVQMAKKIFMDTYVLQ